MKIVLAQSHFKLGDIQYNQDLVLDTIQKYSNSDLIVFPELFLIGYPPEDLLLRHNLYKHLHNSLQKIHRHMNNQCVLLGLPRLHDNKIYNSCAIIDGQHDIRFYDKQYLPNYSVFDEKRYFSKGSIEHNLLHIHGKRILIAICEDIWNDSIYEQAKTQQADLIVSLNASPYFREKYQYRHNMIRRYQQTHYPVPLVYVNCVGGQDELVFDGNSFVMDGHGEITTQLQSFADDSVEIDYHNLSSTQPMSQPLSGLDELYQSLVVGMRDYFGKNNFKSCLLGLSGGIDSAVAACIARDALGEEHVHTVSMPSKFTASMSERDAESLARNLQVSFETIAIQPLQDEYLRHLSPLFQDKPEDVTEENLQARIRGTLLMALSNKHGHMVITTSNKSETAVGYSTLYGDTAGGFCVLKDVYKTEVYQLAHYINRNQEIIPNRIITRPASAELSDNQTDQDSLPPYELLDPILKDFMEHNLDISELTEKYTDEALIRRVVRLVKRNEYKRRQSPPGIKTTKRAFGRDWRYPIAENYLYE